MVRSCHTTCRIALEKAKTEGLIRVNPAVGCKLPPKKAREMQVLSHEEMQRFLIQAKEDGFYEMMLLELATGMRRGEICALQWDDLNLRPASSTSSGRSFMWRVRCMCRRRRRKALTEL